MPSSAPITQAEFGSSILAMFSYVVPDISRVCLPDVLVVLSRYFQSVEVCCLSCQMSVANVLSEYLLSCLRMLLFLCISLYCQSTFLPVWGCHFFFVFHYYESSDVLVKFLQSALGVTSVSAARCLLMYCQSTINLSGGVTPAFCWFWTELSWSCTWAGEQQSPGFLPVWGCLYCQSTFLVKSL